MNQHFPFNMGFWDNATKHQMLIMNRFEDRVIKALDTYADAMGDDFDLHNVIIKAPIDKRILFLVQVQGIFWRGIAIYFDWSRDYKRFEITSVQ